MQTRSALEPVLQRETIGQAVGGDWHEARRRTPCGVLALHRRQHRRRRRPAARRSTRTTTGHVGGSPRRRGTDAARPVPAASGGGRGDEHHVVRELAECARPPRPRDGAGAGITTNRNRRVCPLARRQASAAGGRSRRPATRSASRRRGCSPCSEWAGAWCGWRRAALRRSVTIGPLAGQVLAGGPARYGRGHGCARRAFPNCVYLEDPEPAGTPVRTPVGDERKRHDHHLGLPSCRWQPVLDRRRRRQLGGLPTASSPRAACCSRSTFGTPTPTTASGVREVLGLPRTTACRPQRLRCPRRQTTRCAPVFE